MSLLDINCQDAISYSIDNCVVIKNYEQIYLGNYNNYCNYFVYLFFNLPNDINPENLMQARLILSKVPHLGLETNSKCMDNNYSICPLLDFFNDNVCAYCNPCIDFERRIDFDDSLCLGTLDIDITPIVTSWFYDEIENKGLIICNKNSQLLCFASKNYKTKSMQPFIRLKYKNDNITPSMKCVPSIISM